MWIKNVQLKGIKSFDDSGLIEFSRSVNVLVGNNSAGKSTILRTLHVLQPVEGETYLATFFKNSLRSGQREAEAWIDISEPNETQIARNQVIGLDTANIQIVDKTCRFRFSGNPESFKKEIKHKDGNLYQVNPLFYSKEPNNFIYPYFSRRKASQFDYTINSEHASAIEEVYKQLPSKIDSLLNIDSPFLDYFRNACESILNLKITCIQFGGGKHAGIKLQDETLLPIDNMGEGVLHILSFLVHLCSAKGKLFLIEEIENDLHPKALKRLLDLILEKSATNQFIITTHNNIVIRQLGSEPTTNIFSLEMKLDETTKIPTSSCKLVSNSPSDRIKLLENLGYELSDYYLWSAYLILEESTAERIIRDFLIPHMVPKLQGNLRTIAAQGITDVEARFCDFHRLFVFIHTTPAYKHRAWVAVDNGTIGKRVVSDLLQKFKDWPENHFRYFKSENFEKYYPPQFQDKVEKVLRMSNDLDRQKEKGKLAEEVLNWAVANQSEAIPQFSECAEEVLNFLKEIEAAITKT